MAADLNRITVVTLDGRHELDAAVAVLVVVPVDERHHPLTGLVFGGKWLAGVFRPILHRPEQRFRVRVVVGDPWTSRADSKSVPVSLAGAASMG